jgi:hypothetical protein
MVTNTFGTHRRFPLNPIIRRSRTNDVSPFLRGTGERKRARGCGEPATTKLTPMVQADRRGALGLAGPPASRLT